MIVLGAESGALNAVRAAQAFRQACEAMRSANPSPEAIATLRAITGNAPDLDEAVASRLLRLGGARRAAFEAVKKLQNVPRLDSLARRPMPAKLWRR
ncbi:MAG: hypothetical protein WDO73_20535 [Ignavibacteriota bacterium]